MELTAKLSSPAENAKNLSYEKETVRYAAVVVSHKGDLITPISARWWMGRSASASVVYCSVWASGKGVYASGHGRAGGGGYHKESAALDSALSSAGFTLSRHFGGRGDRAIDDALIACVRAMGYRGKSKVVGHG